MVPAGELCLIDQLIDFLTILYELQKRLFSVKWDVRIIVNGQVRKAEEMSMAYFIIWGFSWFSSFSVSPHYVLIFISIYCYLINIPQNYSIIQYGIFSENLNSFR